MGSRAAGNKRRRLHALPLLAVSLAMLLASVPALAAQAPGSISEEDTAPIEQDNPAQVPPGGSPVEPPPAGSPGVAPGVCEHAPGEFLVGYASVEDLQAVPPENVVETFEGILAQHLVFEEIKNIPDPAKRLAAEEAKRQELLARPGVAYVEYNCIAQVNQVAESASDLRAPASCGDCGRYVVDRAKKIITDGLGNTDDRDAFNAALEAARSADDDNVAFASEASEEAASDGGSAGSSNDTADSGDDTDDSASDDVKAEAEGSGSGTGGTAKAAGEEVPAGKSSSDDTQARPKGEYTLAEANEEPVSGKNAAATSRPREMRGSGDGFLTIGAGALLLVAGVFVARRTFGG